MSIVHTTSALFERIEHEARLLALIVRGHGNPDQTTFLTENSLPFQAGFIVYPRGGEVIAHVHKPLRRELNQTSEALFVREGRCLLDIYDENRRLLSVHPLAAGDIVLLYGGGHGIRMPDSNCVLFEIKQGPYLGVDEKERFQP